MKKPEAMGSAKNCAAVTPQIRWQTGVWVWSLLERKPTRLVTVAIANKTARNAWALLAKGETYKTTPAT